MMTPVISCTMYISLPTCSSLQVAHINKKMGEALVKLREAQRRHTIYTRFSESPVQAINEIIASNSKELRLYGGVVSQVTAVSKVCGGVGGCRQQRQHRCVPWCNLEYCNTYRRCIIGASGWRMRCSGTCHDDSTPGGSTGVGSFPGTPTKPVMMLLFDIITVYFVLNFDIPSAASTHFVAVTVAVLFYKTPCRHSCQYYRENITSLYITLQYTTDTKTPLQLVPSKLLVSHDILQCGHPQRTSATPLLCAPAPNVLYTNTYTRNNPQGWGACSATGRRAPQHLPAATQHRQWQLVF